MQSGINSLWQGLHRLTARLHGAEIAGGERNDAGDKPSDDFVAVYAAYADSVAQANSALRDHGRKSPQFAAADVASMRLFHRAKKMQGLKKPKS